MFTIKEKTQSVSAEAYRTLRTNIQYSSFDKKVKSIVITSAEPGEGKSTTCSNLAISFAQNGEKVILIDCDLRKPSMHKIFKISNIEGLSDILIGKEKFENIVKQDIENLYLLPAGKIPPNPAEMLGSKNMEKLLEKLKQEFDIIILDTAPLQAVTDAQILSTKTDATILVVKSNVTKKESILKTKKLLEKVEANIIGTILNGVEEKRGKYYHYYGNDNK